MRAQRVLDDSRRLLDVGESEKTKEKERVWRRGARRRRDANPWETRIIGRCVSLEDASVNAASRDGGLPCERRVAGGDVGDVGGRVRVHVLHDPVRERERERKAVSYEVKQSVSVSPQCPILGENASSVV